MSKKRIILLDGNNLVCRAFFALPPSMMTSTGQPTNAAYGFATMLIKLIKDYKPDQVIAAFDLGKSKRASEYAEYKAHRPEAPDELKSQFPLIKEMLKVLKIPVIEIEGEEADDILATLAKESKQAGDLVYIVTNDKDVMQLVGEGINLLSSKKGLTEIQVFDRAAVIDRFGVPPERMVDYLGLKGDSSDNIPGVAGIGEKTAQKLVSEFGSLEEIFERLSEISSAKLKEKLVDEKEIALLSKKLATLDDELPLSERPSLVGLGSWGDDELRVFLERMEFMTLIPRFSRLKAELGKGDRVASNRPKVIEVQEASELSALVKRIEESRAFSFIMAGDDHDGGIFSTGPRMNVSFSSGQVYLIGEASIIGLKPLLESKDIKKATYDAKREKRCLAKLGIELNGVSFDVMVAAYLIDSLRNDYSLSALTGEFLGQDGGEEDEAAFAASIMNELSLVLKERLDRLSLSPLFDEVELPLTSVLADMEMVGVGLDLTFLKQLAAELEAELAGLKAEIFSLAGEEFNLNSSKQLGEVLFERLGLDCNKRTKTGYSTDSSVLVSLLGAHPIIDKILQYREAYKLLSTYVLPLPRLVDKTTGRLHTTFNQTVTATGRLSSSNPNLQNIPVRTEVGQKIREAFIPSKVEDKLLVADYSQIELRILAHLSEDANLIDAFGRGEDIHTFTASQVFSVSEAEVTRDMRRAAKAVNFGIVYGLSPFGLSEQLKIEREEAARYIDEYFERYASVKRYIDDELKKAYNEGHVRTIFGRVRRLPELASSDFKVRSFGERLAINFPIQGAAADIIKIAMIRISNELIERKMETKMILQVHDELVFEVPPVEAVSVSEMVKRIMEGVCNLKVGLEAEIKMGHNWRSAK
ncbi:MAG: DNA polymerase I [Actinomycetota bacterium]|nr:DNA polymerase I [Actinomycetota bacterium]